MRKIKIKENKPYKFSLRLTDEQYTFILSSSKNIGVSPSDYIRMLIDFRIIESRGIKNHENI